MALNPLTSFSSWRMLHAVAAALSRAPLARNAASARAGGVCSAARALSSSATARSGAGTQLGGDDPLAETIEVPGGR